jgi:acyl-homoserine lactone acylase PvdQ
LQKEAIAAARTAAVDEQLALAAPLPSPEPEVTESRSVMIGQKRSASGNVLMVQATSDGPHIRYVGAGFDAYGYTRQGGGGLVMGRGPKHGWLQNVGMDDQFDVFAEKLNPENQYQYWFQGKWHDMERRTEKIQVRGRADETIEIVTTVHGPVVAWNREKGLAYAEKNALRGHELNDWVCNLEFGRANSLAEFERWVPLCSATATINYGGEDGTLAHWHAGRRPIRAAGLDPRLPTPGTGEYEWQGMLPFSKWSKFMNPPEGFWHAWNTRPSPAVLYGDRSRWGATSRNYLAYDLVKQYDKITMEDFKRINQQLGNSWTGDIPSGKFFAPYLKPAVAGNARLERAVELIAGWKGILEDLDGDGYYDNPALGLMDRWLEVADEAIVGAVIGGRAAGGYRTAVLHRAIQGKDAGLPMKFDWFKGRDRNKVLRDTVARVVDELTTVYKTADMTAWKTTIYWRYYGAAEFGKHPDKPSRRDSARDSTAARLGLIPFAIPDNGSEQWNGILEVTSAEKRVWDASPSGGQNLFINLAGEATPNISDQLMRHATFDLKRVEMDPEAMKAKAVSVVKLDVPAFD